MTGGELVPAGTDDALLLAVLERGDSIDVEVIERIVALKERTDDRTAARSMYDAIARFQNDCPAILKTKSVDYASRKGGRVSYSYAPLEEIARTIRIPLFENGLGYTWDSETTEAGGVRAVCTLRHRDGAKLTASFEAPVNAEAKMSAPQRTAAALTYARRQSLVQVLGLTTADEDNDGEDGVTGETIDHDQRQTLGLYIGESGADLGKFLKWLGIESLDELDAGRYEEALDALRARIADTDTKGEG